jgi:hypothetical protein
MVRDKRFEENAFAAVGQGYRIYPFAIAASAPAVVFVRTAGAGKVILAIGAEDFEFGLGIRFCSDRGHLCFRAKKAPGQEILNPNI